MACRPDPQRRLTFMAWRLVRDASLHGGDPGQIHIARFGVDDMTKGDMADLLGCNLLRG
jgi:hypothetical protein